ncbi:hypothetical protein [Pelagibaculum spongiae]|uniref:Uncharacterized protein n=1 Tax=Pelagibaculum spongiae TaxID=2080658 RepID=A0A2V1GXM0_9GAMM|nr:hypothetical protein [Pelagibaculum spongiae]PVZ69748.1 hypothetical protein DC094_10650 [Pelagibaculum spongiae]
MLDVHIDDFYKDISVILLTLFRNFPCKANLYVDDLTGPAVLDEFGLQDRRFRSALSAMSWLAEEGYIRHSGDYNPDGLDQAVLSERAFKQLTKAITISDVSEQQQIENIASIIEQAIHDRSSIKIKHACQMFFGSIDTAAFA